MQITPSIIDAIFYSFRLDYQGAYERAAPWHGQVAAIIPSTQRENRYAWMKLIPRLKEWIGERVLNNLSARGYTIVNKDYEDTIAVDRNDIEDDSMGVYAPAVQTLGQQAALWPDDLMTICIQSGTTNLCFDGQPFFDDSHPVDGDNPALGVYANDFELPLNHENFAFVRATMMSYLGEDGKPLKVMPKLLLVPPQLEQVANQILKATIIAPAGGFAAGAAQSQDNVLKGSADLLVIPEFANEPTTWYLIDNSKPIKAFIFQLRKAPVLVSLTDPTSENVFFQRKFIFGVDARGNTGYSLPFLAARSKPAA